MAEQAPELRINLRGPNRPALAPESEQVRQAILAIGRRLDAAMARLRLADAEEQVRHLPRIHYADHLTGGDPS